MTTALQTIGNPDPDFRGQHVGASEIAALFDESPFVTHFELWYRKQGTIAPEAFPGGERAEWGVRLEAAIIEGAAERYGYSLERTPAHLSNGRGLGGHPDRYASDERGPGILEVKTVDWLIRKGWGDEPPVHYLLQAQAYAGLADRKWCDIIVLVGGNSLERFQYDFRPKLYSEIEKRVAEFWRSIEVNDPPKPDFARDGKALAEVLGEPTDEVADLRHDNEASHLACQWLAAKARVKAAEVEAEEAKTALMMKIGSAGRAVIDGYRVGCGMTKGTADKTITAEMVGEIIKGRRGYRRFDVKEKV